ncbi:hypothetical protein SKAU_G00329380 [Synaphobranchus kaupii]|uniref:Uncharacterized protein n=1 Tax=Synaphobranchus kaupii TaxID=118154 RepID=A0A9Q1EQ62_SYNKA|nr:hypothetical protein SKAU_G00329380 [Synaphobranchus kaupii]
MCRRSRLKSDQLPRLLSRTGWTCSSEPQFKPEMGMVAHVSVWPACPESPVQGPVSCDPGPEAQGGHSDPNPLPEAVE